MVNAAIVCVHLFKIRSYLWHWTGETFIKGNVAITATGVAIRDSPKSFTVVYEELQIGETIGRGSSSVVLRGLHTPSGTQLALKVDQYFILMEVSM